MRREAIVGVALVAIACGGGSSTSPGAGEAAGSAGAKSSVGGAPSAGHGGAASGAAGANFAGSGGSAGLTSAGAAGSIAGGSGGSVAAGAGGTAGTMSGGSGGSAIERTVETRNPFGALTADTNYVMDGDFERSPTSAIAPAWLFVLMTGVTTNDYRTGGDCFSGVFCANVADGVALTNTAGSVPPGAVVTLSAEVKPADGKCASASVSLYVESGAGADGGVLASGNGLIPDSNGWCAVKATYTVPATVHVVQLYVQPKGTSVLVDDVRVTATGGASLPSPPLPPAGRERARALIKLRNERTLVRGPRLPRDR